MRFAIRSYVSGDLPVVVELISGIVAEHGLPFDVGPLRAELENRDNWEGNAPLWVAEVAGEVIGTVAIRPKGASVCELKRLYVRAPERGRGLGRALYLHAEAFARAAGYERIWLETSRRFVGAARLYVRSGFVLVEEIDNVWEDSVYEKILGSAQLS